VGEVGFFIYGEGCGRWDEWNKNHTGVWQCGIVSTRDVRCIFVCKIQSTSIFGNLVRSVRPVLWVVRVAKRFCWI
jgi:hypothetical protein